MKTIKIALASSNELKADREAFRTFISVENDRLHEKGIYLKLVQWEYFDETMSKTRKQADYNAAMKECDILLSLFFTKVGKFTLEEFEEARTHFEKNDQPVIFTYFKDAPRNMRSINREDLNGLMDFKERLDELGHYPSYYTTIDDFKVQFKRQLDMLLDLWAEIEDPQNAATQTIIQHADKIYNIGRIDDADFS